MIQKTLNYETGKIAKVKIEYSGYTITQEDGWCLGIDKSYGVEPKVGDLIETYGGIGLPIRGICINGKTLFFKGDLQVENERKKWLEDREIEKLKEFEANKSKLDSDYKSLPEVFKKRIDRFRKNNSKFRVDYEAYEMSCCLDAVKIANAMGTVEGVKKFRKWSWEKQKKKVPDLFDGHSGNSFGCAVMLAYLYLKEPQKIYQAHGALSPLVGSKEYGDI